MKAPLTYKIVIPTLSEVEGEEFGSINARCIPVFMLQRSDPSPAFGMTSYEQSPFCPGVYS